MSALRGFFDIRGEELRNSLAAFGTLLAITTGHTILETGRDALFLSKLPAADLPWIYLLIAAFGLGLSQLGRRSGRTDTKLAVSVSLVVAAGVTLGFWAAVSDGSSTVVLFALYVWSGLFASWVMVQFWMLLGRAHTMTQAKRLYGFIGGGAVLGAVLGAVFARALLVTCTPRATLLLASGFFFVAALPCTLLRVPRGIVAAPVARRRRGSMSAGFSALWENAFARRVLGIAIVSTVTVTLADFLFKSTIAARHVGDAHALAAYLSTFYAITNALALVAQLVVAPWVFRILGVQRALFFFPVAIAAAAGGVIATGGSLAAAVTMKGLDGTLRYSLHKTSSELLLVPVPDGTRERVKPIIDLVGTRGGQAAASLAILVLVALGADAGAAGSVAVGAIVLVLSAFWMALVVTIRRLYLDVFRETLKSGGLSGKAELPDLDLGALETLFAGLNSNRDPEVLASLELLADQHRERLIPALILYHPSRDVVLRALELFTTLGRADFVPIADRLNDHPDHEVAAAALRARTLVAPARKILRARLSDACPQVAATALVALMKRRWIKPEDADARLEAMLQTKSAKTAAELARSIRDIAATSEDAATDARFDALLIRLAADASTFSDPDDAPPRPTPENLPRLRPPGMSMELSADLKLSLEVARAMAARKNPEFFPLLVNMLGRHALRVTARDAMADIPGGLEYLDRAMDDPALSRIVRAHIPRTMSRLDPDLASRLLLPRLLTEKDGAVRYRVIRALIKLRRKVPVLRLDEDVLRQAIDSTLEHVGELRRWSFALSSEGEASPDYNRTSDPLRAAHHLLLDLVRDKATHATQRAFLLLELLQGENFDDIVRGLRSADPNVRASSLELIENLVDPPIRARVLALVGDTPALADALDYEGAVREILEANGTTLRTLAEYRAAELGIPIPTGDERPSRPPTIESIGKRLLDRAREALSPGPINAGARRAPA